MRDATRLPDALYATILLHEVSREVVAHRVPPFVYAGHEKFALCDHCGRVYWSATHLQRALDELDALGL